MRLNFLAVIGLSVLAVIYPAGVASLPAGRSWIPVDTLSMPGFDYMAGPALDVYPGKPPVLRGNALKLPRTARAYGFSWVDSAWALRWDLGRGTSLIWPVLARRDREFLIWQEVGPPAPVGITLAEVLEDTLVVADTVTYVSGGSAAYAASMGGNRRWVVADDWDGARLYFSDTARAWNYVPAPIGAVFGGVAVAALDDSSALVAWPAMEDMRWGIAKGGSWTFGDPSMPCGGCNSPKLRPRPSGGHWLFWGDYTPFIRIAAYRNGVWSAVDSLTCVDAGNAPYGTAIGDASRDGAEHPAVTWLTQDGSGVLSSCISVPTDSGFGPPERIPNASNGAPPTVARDANGDVWVAWWRYFDGIFWMHTYTHATVASFSADSASASPLLSWTLTEPAPESWWAVLRSAGEGPFEPVARLRAGPELTMSWADTAPPAGVTVRYRIRRECVDVRYQWLSEAITWRLRGPALALSHLGANPTSGRVELSLQNADAGSATLQLYDMLGREVWRAAATASGRGRDRVILDFGQAPLRLRAGLYFVRASDSSGRRSNVVRVVLVR